jgi:hypothetical protein
MNIGVEYKLPESAPRLGRRSGLISCRREPVPGLSSILALSAYFVLRRYAALVLAGWGQRWALPAWVVWVCLYSAWPLVTRRRHRYIGKDASRD